MPQRFLYPTCAVAGTCSGGGGGVVDGGGNDYYIGVVDGGIALCISVDSYPHALTKFSLST